MKKLITIFVVITCVFSQTFGQTLKKKEEELFKANNVKAQIKYDYKYVKGKLSSPGIKAAMNVYDEEGRLLEKNSFNPKGTVVFKEVFKYDSKGNRTFYERKGTTGEYKKESDYDEESRLLSEKGYDGSASFRTEYKYNSDNRVTEITYFALNTVDEKRVYTYTGDKAVVEILKGGKNLISKLELLFDKNNNVLEEVVIGPDNKVLEKKLYSYNEQGDIVNEKKYRGSTLFYDVDYSYNDKGDLVTISESSNNDKPFIKKRYTYDNLGRVIKYEWKRNSGDDYNTKDFKYGSEKVCTEVVTFYPKTKYKLLSRYKYEFY